MEIGSEFWLEDKKIEQYEIQNDNKKLFLLSGRTAIDYVLDIIENKKINKAYLPSYCCQSMIDPFKDRNIQIDFYTVKFENGNFVYDIDCNKNCDIFFAMNYFGFNQYNMDYYIEQFKKRNICVIEDSTHSILSKRKYNKKSDFVVASLRKWFPIISGGLLINQSNYNIEKNIHKLKNNEDYIYLKKNAMIEKNSYILEEKKNNKNQFLNEFSRANEILDHDYKLYKIDKISYSILKNINIEEIINQRRKNAEVIYKYLKKQSKIQYLTKLNFNEDIPLFVPVFLPNAERNELKKILIENNIYCPNHWKIPKQIENNTQKNIYNIELSLICDQRYDNIDIESYINAIKYTI